MHIILRILCSCLSNVLHRIGYNIKSLMCLMSCVRCLMSGVRRLWTRLWPHLWANLHQILNIASTYYALIKIFWAGCSEAENAHALPLADGTLQNSRFFSHKIRDRAKYFLTSRWLSRSHKLMASFKLTKDWPL